MELWLTLDGILDLWEYRGELASRGVFGERLEVGLGRQVSRDSSRVSSRVSSRDSSRGFQSWFPVLKGA